VVKHWGRFHISRKVDENNPAPRKEALE